MAHFDGWEEIDRLGEGGQGEVFLVRSPDGRSRRQALLATIQNAVQNLPDRSQRSPGELAESLADALSAYSKGDDPSDLGALKKLRLREDAAAEDKAVQRFRAELEALKEFEGDPSVVRLLHKNVAERFMIMEFHPGGPLSKSSERFKGDVLGALRALYPVVQAVAALHAKGVIHRDIKPDNIFLAADGRLVLGDFGIVFFEDATHTRCTDTYENVGSRDWMPLWASGMRIEDIAPNFDVFCLGKLLWAMVSGHTMLRLWYFKDDENDLEKMYPDDPSMTTVNEILAQCVVERAEQCLKDAGALAALIKVSIDEMASGAERFREDAPRRCRACGRRTLSQPAVRAGQTGDRRLALPLASEIHAIATLRALYDNESLRAATVRLFLCDYCGYLELFHWPDGYAREAWRKTKPTE